MDQEINDNVNQQKGKKNVYFMIRKPAELLCSCITAFLDNDVLATCLHSVVLAKYICLNKTAQGGRKLEN